jgi:hypothetical protein
MSERLGEPMPHLTRQLQETFKTYYTHKIGILRIHIPDTQSNTVKRLRKSLRHIAALFSEAGDDSSTPTSPFPRVYKEKQKIDFNLSLLAGENAWSAEKMTETASKISAMLEKMSQNENTKYEYLTLYDAMFGIKKLQGKLTPPPVEINNPIRMITDTDKRLVPKQTARVVKLALRRFEDEIPSSARLLESVYGKEKAYGNEFAPVEAENIGKRLEMTNGLLEAAVEVEDGPVAENEVLKNIAGSLEMISDDIFAELVVPEELSRSRFKAENMKSGIGQMKFREMVDYYKKRAAIRTKIKGMVGHVQSFSEQEYRIIARDFNLPVQKTKELVELLQSCFDEESRFRKRHFEANVPLFAKYGRKVFVFLWHYLKNESLARNDRIVFLNSLQQLIARLEERQFAMRVLLADVFGNPAVINYSDRNALMLANLLTRTYNKELNMDIELTPEEVLLVRNGLDKEAAKAAAAIIDNYQEIFLIKAMTIQERLKEALSASTPEETRMPIRYLLSLEREIHTFFSLVEGRTACAIMRIAMDEYGDPNAEIYHLTNSSRNMPALLQRLRVVIRGFGRVGKEKDLSLLLELKNRESEFLALGKGMENILQRIMELVDLSVRQIQRNLIY